jgi:hypothetical protein
MRGTSGEFYGKYGGRVVSTSDPLKIGRVKVRVPILHGIGGSDSGLVGDDDLPWTLPSSLAAGGSQESGGVSWIPVVDDQVWVEFLDGELDKPIWSWGNQNLDQAKKFGNLPLHQYDPVGSAVRRSAFTRFSHWWELLPTGHDIWTKSGYHFTIIDEQSPGQPSGKLSWTTALGYLVSLDDSNKTLSVFAPHVEHVCQTESVSATDSFEVTTPLIGLNFGSIEIGGNYQNFQIDGVTRTSRGLKVLLNQLTLLVNTDITIQSQTVNSTQTTSVAYTTPTFGISSASGKGFEVTGGNVKLGLNPNDPVVRLSDLHSAFAALKKIFDTHVHSGIQSGGGSTAIPSIPLILSVTGSSSVTVESSTRASQSVG